MHQQFFLPNELIVTFKMPKDNVKCSSSVLKVMSIVCFFNLTNISIPKAVIQFLLVEKGKKPPLLNTGHIWTSWSLLLYLINGFNYQHCLWVSFLWFIGNRILELEDCNSTIIVKMPPQAQVFHLMFVKPGWFWIIIFL